jgi:glutaredoxin
LPIYPSESSMTNLTLLKWKCFEYETVGVADDGQPRRRIQQVFKETTPTVFLDYMKPKL